MSRSWKDSVGGHTRRDIDYDGGCGWSAHFHRFAKRQHSRHQRRLNKPEARDPELIYPYLNKTSWYIKGSYIVFDFNEYDNWEEDYDWYSYMLDAYWAEEHDNYDEPDFDDYDLFYEDDYDDTDLDWYYDY